MNCVYLVFCFSVNMIVVCSNRKKGVSDRKSINFGADNGGKDESE